MSRVWVSAFACPVSCVTSGRVCNFSRFSGAGAASCSVRGALSTVCVFAGSGSQTRPTGTHADRTGRAPGPGGGRAGEAARERSVKAQPQAVRREANGSPADGATASRAVRSGRVVRRL